MIPTLVFLAILACAASFYVGYMINRPLIELAGTKGHPDCVASNHLSNGEWILAFSDGARYRGEGTVWHHYPSGKRCGTTIESWLSDVSAELEWREEDLAASKRVS